MKETVSYEDPMDIYALPGTKIVFTGKNGWDHEKQYHLDKLRVGGVYTVKETEVHNCSTVVYLNEVDGTFNSTCFVELKGGTL